MWGRDAVGFLLDFSVWLAMAWPREEMGGVGEDVACAGVLTWHRVVGGKMPSG